MLQFNSDVVEPRERLEYFAEFLTQTLAPLRPEPAGERPFQVKTGMRMIGELPVVHTSGAGYRLARGRPEIARSSEHFYVVTIHAEGTASFASEGSERHLARGDIFVLDTMHQLELDLERPYRHLLVKLPKQWIDARLPRPDLLCGSVLAHHHPLANLFAGYLAAGFQMAEQLAPAAATMVAQHLIDLLAEAFAGEGSTPLAPPKAQRAAIFLRACRLIAVKFGDPELRPDRIAEDLRISTRMLHRVFAEHGESVMQHVLNERLDRAAKLLSSPQAGHRTITDIAFACGFNDSSHFGRVFTEAMGVTPSQWRRHH